MSAKTVHMSLSIRGMLMKPTREFNRASKAFTTDDGRPMTPQQVRSSLLELLGKGHEVMPLGECDNFDKKKGCRGHVVKEVQA